MASSIINVREKKMKVTTIPWSRDIPRSTSERAEAETWAYWQNKINRASLVMLHEQGILDDEKLVRAADRIR